MIDSKNLIQRRSLGPITVKLDEKENVVKREMAKLEVAPKEFIQIYPRILNEGRPGPSG